MDKRLKDRINKTLANKTPKDDYKEKFQQKLEKVQEQVNTLEDYETEWTDWEKDFLTNVSNNLENDKPLTDSQLETLEKVYNKYVK